MSEQQIVVDKPRFETLLQTLEEIAVGDLSQRCTISENRDDLDAIALAINMLLEELQEHIHSLEETNRVLRQTNEELSNYARVIAHDLKSPLRGITNSVDILKDDLAGKLEPENHELFSLLLNTSHYSQKMVNDLLKYAELGSNEPLYEWVHLGSLLHEMLPHLQLDQAVNIQIHRLPALTTNPTLWRQIFANLIENGIKFNNSKQKCIEIGSEELPTDEYVIYVKDNGMGIDPKYHQLIFNIFKRLTPETVTDGTGIGLALVKKAVQKLNGKIWVESQPNKGSTFFIQLYT
jgi:two-component system, chemotaxis family, sensor kinase Cph1